MNEKVTEAKAERKVGYAYNLAVNLEEGQALTITGNFPADATKQEMDAELDKLVAVTDRLKAKYKINAKKAEIVAGETMVNAMQVDLTALDEKWQAEGRKPPMAEQNNREAMVRNVRHVKGKIAAHQEELKQLEQIAA